ncbi:PTS lactose/cellobiose transporter subunit IIA [Companilactobacillus sp. HBUAS59544]|uniref:PTS lactose/cellobiose transporter subunit IIA n=1 Tax=Companilactobacillus sp. HBUAS59544 TaxID=3109363 RepID=UPI002FF2AFE0
MLDEQENNEELRQSMQIIIEAGDARKSIMQALDLIGDGDYEASRKNLSTAKQKLVTAHALQTQRIQKEAAGDQVSYSVLFTHAQDTLMSVNSEYNLTKHLIEIFQRKDSKKN